MWRFLESLARPPLAELLRRQAQACDERALVLLRGGEGPDCLRRAADAAAAGAACWHAARHAFPSRHRQAVRSALRKQAGLLAELTRSDGRPSAQWIAALSGHATTRRRARAAEQRIVQAHAPAANRPSPDVERLASLVERRARWHALMRDPLPPDDVVLRRGLVAGFVRTCRSLARAPFSRRTRRRLERQVRVLEILGSDGRDGGPLAELLRHSRRMQALLAERAWLTGLTDARGTSFSPPGFMRRMVAARRQALSSQIRTQAARMAAPPADALGMAVRWACFVNPSGCPEASRR